MSRVGPCGFPHPSKIVWNKKYAHPGSHYIWHMFYEEERITNSFDYRPVPFIEYSFVTAGPKLCMRD